jgi:tellurite resistance protein
MSEREFVLQLADREVAALVEMMFLAAAADGQVDPEELLQLSSSIERVTNGAVQVERARSLVEAAQTALAGSDRAQRLQAVKEALPAPQRKHALLLAIQVAAADGRIRTAERELILETAQVLEIDGDTAADLVNVVEG